MPVMASAPFAAFTTNGRALRGLPQRAAAGHAFRCADSVTGADWLRNASPGRPPRPGRAARHHDADRRYWYRPESVSRLYGDAARFEMGVEGVAPILRSRLT